MDLSERGMALLVSFEGKHKKLNDGRYKAYQCPAGVWTIYVGLTHGVKEGMIVTEEQGQRMLAKELSKYEDAVERLVKVPLNQNQFDVLVSFTFNCGIGALEKSTLLRELNRGHYDAVPSQLMRWANGGGRKLPGLVRRRAAEGALWNEPVPSVIVPAIEGEVAEERAPELMPQKVEPSNPSVVSVATQSVTIRAALVAAAGTLVQGWNWLFSVAHEAGPEIASNQQALSPFSSLFQTIGANAGLIASVVVLGSLGAVVANRLRRDRA